MKTRPKSAYTKMAVRSSSITGSNNQKFVRPMSGKPKTNDVKKGSSIVTYEMPPESGIESFIIKEEDDASTPELKSTDVDLDGFRDQLKKL